MVTPLVLFVKPVTLASVARALAACLLERQHAMDAMGVGCPVSFHQQQEADLERLLDLLERRHALRH